MGVQKNKIIKHYFSQIAFKKKEQNGSHGILIWHWYNEYVLASLLSFRHFIATSETMASPWVPVEDRPASIQTEMIQRLLKEGIQFYKGDEDARALVMFKKAYVLSVSLQEPLTQARCLLNLGAAYITAGKLKKALKCLHRCKETGAMEKDGDLSFNIAAVYDNLREYTTAARFYRKAIGEYGKSRTRSTADAHIKLAYCLVSREDWASAAQSFQLAGDAYRKAQQWEDAAMAMREAANYLLRNPKYCSEDVLETLQACSQLCTEITSQELLGILLLLISPP